MNQTPAAEYLQKRDAIMANYTPRLKALSATDPEYGRLWDERAEALRSLAAVVPADTRETSAT